LGVKSLIDLSLTIQVIGFKVQNMFSQGSNVKGDVVNL